jgi:hypothetical protein
MITTKIFLTVFTVLTSAFTADAAIIDMFNDKNCTEFAGSRNIYDHTCAKTQGFESFRITATGGFRQLLTAYVHNDCIKPYTACTPASNAGPCIQAWRSDGASHAMSSYFAPGTCGA